MSNPTMYCIVCQKVLDDEWSKDHPFEAHPRGALCFKGGAPYGSRFDSDNQNIGLDGYEVFVCDECWAETRQFALGYRTIPRPQPARTYVGGDEILARFRKLEEGYALLNAAREHASPDTPKPDDP